MDRCAATMEPRKVPMRMPGVMALTTGQTTAPRWWCARREDTDVKMMVHGFALARMARARRPSINVIYVTGFPELAAAETPLSGSKLLVKPIDPDALIAAVDAYFSGAGA